MGYRDDREALIHRAETAEADRARTEDRLNRVEQQLRHHEHKDVEDESQLQALRQEVSHLRRKLGIPDPSGQQRHQRTPLLVLAGVGILLVLALGALVLLLLKPAGDHGAHGHAVATAETPVAAVEPRPAQTPPPPPPPPTPRQPTDVIWFGGLVTSQTGDRVEPGAPCLVRAELHSGPRTPWVTVHCAGTLLYDSNEPLGTSIQMRDEDLQEHRTTSEDRFIYTLRYVDTGDRTGPRAQIAMDSSRHELRIFDEGASPFSVTAFVNDVSFPRQGLTMHPGGDTNTPTPTGGSLHVLARPTELSGPVPDAIRQARGRQSQGCELQVRANASRFNCRATLRCGGAIVYGAGGSGYNHCTVTEDVLARAQDTGTTTTDGDPTFELDWPERRVVIADGLEAERWSATFELADHPGCAMPQPFLGPTIDARSNAPQIRLRRDGDQMEIEWIEEDSVTGTERGPMASACHRGVLVIGDTTVEGPNLVPGRYTLTFGPGFATLGGRWSSQIDGVFAAAIQR